MMQNSKTGEMTNTDHNSGLIKKIINWSLAGNGRTDIIDLVRSHSLEHITNAECDHLIKQSKQVLEQTVSKDAQQTVTIHTGWYEQIYKYFHSISHVDGQNKSMAGKERLLGMTGGGSKVVLNRRTQINISRKVVEYDEGKLSLSQKDRLKILSEKISQ